MTLQDVERVKREMHENLGMPHPKKRLLHHIRRIHDKIERDGNLRMKAYDLTLVQGHVLGFLLSSGGSAPLKDLERALKVAQSTSAGIVARLEKSGHICTFQDEADKRIKIVSITKSGLDTMHVIGKTVSSLESEILSPLSEEEKEQFATLLEKIARGIDEK